YLMAFRKVSHPERGPERSEGEQSKDATLAIQISSSPEAGATVEKARGVIPSRPKHLAMTRQGEAEAGADQQAAGEPVAQPAPRGDETAQARGEQRPGAIDGDGDGEAARQQQEKLPRL